MKTIKERKKEENELLIEVLFEENDGDELKTFQDYGFIKRSMNLMKTRLLTRRKSNKFNQDMMNIIDLAIAEENNGVNPYK